MRQDQSLPLLWLLSDTRNDAGLEAALARLPRGSGFVFRHYHLAPGERAARFEALARQARNLGHLAILARDTRLAADLGADGVYGALPALEGAPGMRLATAHDGNELQAANAAGVDGVFLSPVFPTRSHADACPLGVHGFHVLAMQSRAPVIALGGMNDRRARELAWSRWGAIDGLA